ncbi:MAG: T9SS C-terminal target domain-containing protein [Ignavibacteriales bacterium]|nr:MAG: T9SS C-terminal target domain-containing protein [Ignavibacteriales bacterium]
MKKQYAFLFLFLILTMATVSAQSTTDTVYIPGTESLNISKIINADTSVTEHRVYVLDRGAIYYIERAFELTHSCKFIAKGNATTRPPVLAAAIRADGSAEWWYFKLIKEGISVELNDLYLLSMTPDGKTLGWSRAIHIGSNNCALKLRRVVFDGWTESGVRPDGVDFFKLDVQDCHFRNFIHTSSYFGGQPFLTGNNDHPDTVIFKNNTFFACASYLWSIRGYTPYATFEHNTVIYGIVNPTLIRTADNTYFNNNLFYASHAWGGDPGTVIGGGFLNYPDTASSGIYQIRKQFTFRGYETVGPEIHYADLGLTYDPSKRTNVAQNNSYFWPEKLTKFYQDFNDTTTLWDSVEVITGPKQWLKRVLVPARWINDLGLETIDSLSNPSSWDYSPNVSFQNNVNTDPQFSDANVVNHIDQVISYVGKIQTSTLDEPWTYELNFPPKWPIPENLAYTNNSLIHGGTDGYALGDLNWFPEQKSQWATDVETISTVVPEQFKLSQNYPNPFNPETKIEFNIPKEGNIRIVIYNILGQKINTLVNQDFKAGSYSVTWNGKDQFGKQVATGAYLYSLETESFKTTKKMILMK